MFSSCILLTHQVYGYIEILANCNFFKWNGENISSNDECWFSNEPNLKEVDYDTSFALSSNITTRKIAFCRMNNVKECCSVTSNGYEACTSNRTHECCNIEKVIRFIYA